MVAYIEEDDYKVNSDDEFDNLKDRHKILPILVCHHKVHSITNESPGERLNKYTTIKGLGMKSFNKTSLSNEDIKVILMLIL